ncbi:MAG: ABC transporter transmembrane domain-containing protein [Paracoccaceae bacterium]|nr:ABC transporter transmembrane domain-containing protein [Paracoccaceae bacterium]MDP7185653.1 ABC transporter transmembrane domain-containing protein [Paracoccaceae bacterium]
MARGSFNNLEGMDRETSKSVGALRALLPFVAPYKGIATLAAVALVVTAVFSLLLPMMVRLVVDNFGAEQQQIDFYFAAAIGVAGLLAAGTALRFMLVTRLGERVVADFRMAVYNKTIGMSPAFFEKIMTGEVLSRITTDTTLILTVIGSSVSMAMRNLLIFIGGLTLMMVTSPKLTGLVLLIVPLVIVPIITLGRRVRRLSMDNQDWIAKSSGKASEALLSVQTVQAFTQEKSSRQTFADVTEASFQSAKRRINTRSLMTAIVIFLVFTGVIGVLWIGAYDVRSGAMSSGALIQFVIYAVMVAGSIATLTEIWGDVQRAAGATERLIELLNARDEVVDPKAPKALPAPVRGEIAFQDVSFRYPTRPDAPALEDVSLTVKHGETVALVGPSGAGKSTMIQLMLRFYDVDFGQITLDGTALDQMARTDLRSALSLVPQDPVIFADSARENIRFGRPEASDAEVEAAARAAAAHEFISKLPDGYDTFVGERGVMLSGGQKQRIAIARAILRDAPILLLDEATSALDAESERAVQSAVDMMSEGRTTIIVAHRLATVKKADRIIVMDQGRIAAQGTHDELVAQGGLYARLARLQFTDGIAAE